jgi:ubiquinone biosynthesis protein
MGRVLNYLFEVTERFGMETRTELILLQRTMVVVEGVARTLNPHINIWQVSQPIVEDYIKQSIGPKALARDLFKTARVLARFGPKLPQLAEAALIAQTNSESGEGERKRTYLGPLLWASTGGLVALCGSSGSYGVSSLSRVWLANCADCTCINNSPPRRITKA